MGVVTDIKQALRAANILRVMYNGTDERMVMRMLPPRSASSPGVMWLPTCWRSCPAVPRGKIALRYGLRSGSGSAMFFWCCLNGNGKMMVGTADALELIDPRELTSRVGAFVRNVSATPGWPRRW